MTNAEKFKEVFGFEFALAPYEADCWCPFQRTKCRDTEFDCFEDCVKPFWQSEYQGEPTIPLSVIEDIKAEIEQEYKRFRNMSDKWDERANGIGTALEIIDRKVNEVKGDKE